jgi:hypothetical protein
VTERPSGPVTAATLPEASYDVVLVRAPTV